MSKIFIVEDDENIRELVMYVLNSNNFECMGFESGSDFFEELKHNMPNLVLLDIMLPGEDGMTILRKLKQNKQTEQLPVIIITAKSNEYDKVKGFDLGSDDYITKPFSVLELLARIKAVLRRSATANKVEDSKEPIKFQNLTLDTDKHLVLVDNQNVVLTYKEFELLQLLLENKDIVLSRNKIMEYIWGFDFECESRTVDMHIKTLRQKLGSAGVFIKTIRGVGYKIGD